MSTITKPPRESASPTGAFPLGEIADFMERQDEPTKHSSLSCDDSRLANFRELRNGEVVRKIPLLRTRVKAPILHVLSIERMLKVQKDLLGGKGK